jgi:phage tail-like protein
MDANGTPYDLLLGRDDWARCTDGAAEVALSKLWDASPPAPVPSDLAWDESRKDLTLRPELLLFQAGSSDRPVSLEDRRGAACDRFGNWYWIADDRRSIQVRNSGDATVRTFWPVTVPADPANDAASGGTFHPTRTPAPCPVLELAGLVVTADQYLVAGVVDMPGYLRFDLQGGGAPRRVSWPPNTILPFDLATRPRGGFFLLDRIHRRLWEFDRAFQIVSAWPAGESPTAAPIFGPASPAVAGAPCPSERALRAEEAVGLELDDPIAVESLPDGSVLILDRPADSALPRIAHYQRGEREADLTGLDELPHQLADTDPAAFRLTAQDFAVATMTGPDATEQLRLYLVSSEGNQAFAFDLSGPAERLHLHALGEYLPMRRFGGRALVRCTGRIFYDSLGNWVPLIEQKRPRYATEGELVTPVLDSHTPDCVWHRILFDGSVPPESHVEIQTRAANSPEELDRAEWSPEPIPLRRPTGSELPWLPAEPCADRGTWETLCQRASGRYAQLRVRLSGNGRITPRLRALRFYRPRFSYLRQYLPPVYRDDAVSASLLDRLLANFEGQWTALEDRMAAVQVLFDARTAPPETLEWLATWFGAVLDPVWDETRRRLFVRHAMTFFAYRGTVPGLDMALRLMFDCRPDDSIFSVDIPTRGRQARYRIVERFRQRPPLALDAVTGSTRWTPELGADELHQRWRTYLGTADTSVLYPVRRPTTQADAWTTFSRAQLGFVPRATDSDLVLWQEFLRQRYSGDLVALNDAHDSDWTDFDGIQLPDDLPAEGDLRDDWEIFNSEARGPDGVTQSALWNDFLRRRYRNIRFLQQSYGPTIAAFEYVPLPAELPTEAARVADWFSFEGVVLPMQEAAHRFTVLVPLTTMQLGDSVDQRREVLRLADRIIRLEKPAHTVFDVQVVWAAFRVGSARLGDDTILGAGSRDPELWPGFELGSRHLSEGFLAARPPRDCTDRLQVGHDRVPRPSRSTTSSRRFP